MTMQPVLVGVGEGRPSALVSRWSSFLPHPLGLGDNFSRVASLLGNKNKLNQCPLCNSLSISSDGVLMDSQSGWIQKLKYHNICTGSLREQTGNDISHHLCPDVFSLLSFMTRICWLIQSRLKGTGFKCINESVIVFGQNHRRIWKCGTCSSIIFYFFFLISWASCQFYLYLLQSRRTGSYLVTTLSVWGLGGGRHVFVEWKMASKALLLTFSQWQHLAQCNWPLTPFGHPSPPCAPPRPNFKFTFLHFHNLF